MGLVEEIASSFEDENDDDRIKAADAYFEIDREYDPIISNPILLNNCTMARVHNCKSAKSTQQQKRPIAKLQNHKITYLELKNS